MISLITHCPNTGFHIGNHRLASHKLMPYEEDVRVPFYIRGPGITKGVVRIALLCSARRHPYALICASEDPA